MKRRLKLAAIAALLTLAVALASGIAYLRSERFQLQLRDYVVSRIERATGMKCAMGAFLIDMVRLHFAVTDFALEPAEGKTSFIQLKIARIEARLRLRSFWRLQVDLEQLTVERPQITLTAGRGGSGWNSARFRQILDRSLGFAARRVELRNGWLLLNHRRVALDLLLEDFECLLSHETNPLSYNVRIEYGNGAIDWAGRHIAHGLSAQVRLLSGGLDIQSFAVRREQSAFTGHGELRSWDSPALSLATKGTIGDRDFILAGRTVAETKGQLDVAGDLRWSGAGFAMQGRFSSASLGFRAGVLAGVEGSFEIRDRVLYVTDVRGTANQGRFVASGAVQLASASTAPHAFDVTVSAMPLSQAARILETPRLSLENQVDAKLRLGWRSGPPDLTLDLEARLHGVPDAAGAGSAVTALDGEIAVGYRKGLWDIRRIQLRSTDSAVEIVQTGEGLAKGRLETARPEEIFRVARRVIPPLDEILRERTELAALTGRFDLEGDLELHLPERFAFSGHAKVAGGRYGPIEVDTLSTDVVWNLAGVRLHSLQARQGRQSLAGSLAVHIPQAEGEALDFEVQGNAGGITLDHLRSLGLEVPAGVSGTLSASGTVGARAGHLQGSGKVRIDEGSYDGSPFDFVQGEITLEGRRILIREAQLSRGIARIDAVGTLDLDSREMNLNGRLAEIPLQDIPALRAREVDVDGLVNAGFKVRGTAQSPVVESTVELKDLRYGSWDLGRGRGEVNLANRLMSISLSISSPLGQLEALARISTEPGYQGRAEIQVKDWDLQRTVQSNLPALLSEVSTALQGRVEIEGSFAEARALRATGELDGARLKIRDYELHNQDKIRFRIAERRLRLEEARIVGEGSSLVLAGEIPLERGAALDLALKGRLDVRSLPRVAESISLGGTAELDVRIGGTLADPQVIGQSMLQDFLLAHGNIPFHLSAARGKVTFSRNAIALENIQGAVGTGSAAINGIVEHRNARLHTVNLQISVRRARLPYPQGFRSVLDADLTLRGDGNSQGLVGKINVVRADYLSEFNLLGGMAEPGPAPAAARGQNAALSGISLNVAVSAPDGLYIDNQLARVRGRADLLVRGSLADPSITGRIEALEGTIFFRGNRFDILRATADFTELQPLNPTLNIRAETDIKRYRLRLEVGGDLNDPRLNLTSDPSLPTLEIVLLLTSGIAREDPTIRSDLTDEQLMRAGAASVISAGLTGAIDQRVRRLFGFESFRVDPYWVGSTQDPTARVTVSERFSKDLTVTYSRNLSTNEEQVVVIEYAIGRNLTLVASQDEKGDFGVDFRFRKRLR